MVEIKAFKGIHYNLKKFNDLSELVSPPYDVINEQMQEELYNRSEHNIVKIIKGKDLKGDTEKSNKYTRAGKYLDDWLKQGIMVRDDKDAIYIYAQDFEAQGTRYERTGFIALVKLEGYGKGVMPHEFTLMGPKADRLNLMRTTRANTGQIFCLYPDQKKVIDNVLEAAKSADEPMVDTVDSEGIRHRLWSLTDRKGIDKIANEMARKQLFIADGHHRYETANNYSLENPKLEGAKFCMMTFVNLQNEGLVVLPTHRLVKNLKNFDIKKFDEQLRSDFEIKINEFNSKTEPQMRSRMFDEMKRLYEEGKHAFGMYCRNNRYYTLALKTGSSMDKRKDIPAVLKALDVTILHSLILEQNLGIDKEKLAKEANIEYIKDTGTAIQDAIEMVNSGEYQLVFFMNSPKVDEIELVAGAGEKMPQKSTFFYPKVYSGFVLNKFD